MSDTKYKVVEIFSSVEGEGIRAGCLCTFIRLYGCNLRCNYSDGSCDTPYGYEGDNYEEMTLQEILDKVDEFGNYAVTITGGEPLIHPNVDKLVDALIAEDYHGVNIETNGSVDIYAFCNNLFSSYDTCNNLQLMFTVDYKCPSSGMESSMMKNYVDTIVNTKQKYQCDVCVKFVVANEQDLMRCKQIVEEFNAHKCLRYRIYIHPVFGKLNLSEIVNFMKLYKDVFQYCKVGIQLHKYIWDPNKRGV